MTKLFIGPPQTGLQRNREPMWIPNDAYTVIEDMYVWRGRTVKKQGYKFLGRLHLTPTLPEALANVNSGVFTYNATLANAPVSPGTLVVTITLPAGAYTFTDNGNGTLTATAVPAGMTLGFGVIDYETGTFDLYFDPVLPGGGPFPVNATAYRYLPRLSVMGLGAYEQDAINRELLIAFDEDYSYLYNTATGIFDVLLDSSAGNPVKIWTGSNSNFFWTTNYYRDTAFNKLFWETNNVANTSAAPPVIQDGIQIYNGTFWYSQVPQLTGAPLAVTYLRGCLMLIPYRDRMVALNTLEGAIYPAAATRYPNRARWSQNGIPYTTGLAGADANAWRHDQVGRGGYIDAPTSEAIVSAAFNKDTLIVFFERSTWQLRYVYSEAPLPFVWEHLDSELGSESTFSSVVFDDGVLTIGDKAIIASNSVQVTRIDEKIPNFIFNIHNDNDGHLRVHGIRDLYNKMVYWCYPDDDANEIFPGKVLALNYEEKSYSIFNDTFTCFGTWQSYADYTWDTLPYETWNDWTTTWSSAKNQSYFPNIIAGNQCGFVEIFNLASSNSSYADIGPTIAIPTSITNANPAVCHVEDHNLQTGQFVKLLYTRGFTENVVNEAVGTALAGSTWFTGSLDNLGVFPASSPTAGGPNFVSVQIGAYIFTDTGDGNLIGVAGAGVGNGIINYEDGSFTVAFAALGADTAVTANYSYNILNYRVFYVDPTTANTFALYSINATTGLTEGVDLSAYGAAYTGSGEVVQIPNFKLRTKRFNPFLEEAASIRMKYFDMLLDENEMTFTGKILADQDSDNAIVSYNISSSNEDGSGLSKEKIWKRVFSNSTSDFIQLEFGLSNYQITQFDNYSSNLVIHTMILDVEPAGRNINRS